LSKDTHESYEELIKLSFFTDIGKAITSAKSVKETVQEVMAQIGKVFAPSYWSLLLRNPATGDLKFSVVVGSGVEALKGQTIPRGKGVAGWIAESGEAVIIEDVSRDKRFSSAMDELTKFKTKSIIGVPLKTNNKVFGVIELINRQDGGLFSPLELQLLSTIADFAAIAIERAYYLRALRKIAAIDPLTGLYNRRSFQRYLEKEIERSKRAGSILTLLMVDIDEFKHINDTYGHIAGDKVLKTVANLLTANVRKADIVARYGGDEFIVLMPDSPKSDAEKAKVRISETLVKRNREASIKINISVGIHESDGSDNSEILNIVDRSMYMEKNKKQERNIENVRENIEDAVAEE